MNVNRFIEYTFFFGFLGVVGYLVWQLFSPFVTALALAAIIVTICYPLYGKVLQYTPWKNRSLAALFTTMLVIVIVIVPVLILGTFVFREAVSIYNIVNNGSQFSITQSLTDIEAYIQTFVPAFTIDTAGFIQQVANFIASHIAAIFTATASTVFMFFIALIASFYLFRDGKAFVKYLIKISPMSDREDNAILDRLVRSVRSVALGTVLVALIQGVLSAIGLAIFGFEHFVLWGSVAAFGALVPGIGTTIVFIPAIIYLIANGAYFPAVGLAIWAALAVGLIDNLLGPYLMSRGGTLHPLLILLSVLGGIVFFGPIGFIIGPVIMTLFKVLLELYILYISEKAK
jgi:predicted PurR-regulated permease PerM